MNGNGNAKAEHATHYDHISLTGRYAGERVCGRIGGTACHLPYVRDVDAWAREHVACEDCRRILAESASGEEGDHAAP